MMQGGRRKGESGAWLHNRDMEWFWGIGNANRNHSWPHRRAGIIHHLQTTQEITRLVLRDYNYVVDAPLDRLSQQSQQLANIIMFYESIHAARSRSEMYYCTRLQCESLVVYEANIYVYIVSNTAYAHE